MSNTKEKPKKKPPYITKPIQFSTHGKNQFVRIAGPFRSDLVISLPNILHTSQKNRYFRSRIRRS